VHCSVQLEPNISTGGSLAQETLASHTPLHLPPAAPCSCHDPGRTLRSLATPSYLTKSYTHSHQTCPSRLQYLLLTTLTVLSLILTSRTPLLVPPAAPPLPSPPLLPCLLPTPHTLRLPPPASPHYSLTHDTSDPSNNEISYWCWYPVTPTSHTPRPLQPAAPRSPSPAAPCRRAWQ
jgi:hypothetical protein